MKEKFLGILFLALCGILAWKHAESGQLKQQISTLEVEVATWKAAAKTAPQPPENAVKSSAATSAAEAPPSDPTPSEGTDEKPKNKFAKAMGEMFKNEASKAAMKNQMRTMLESLNKDLMEMLNLDPATQEKLLDIMASAQAKEQELGMKMMTGEIGTKEEREAMFKGITDSHKEAQAAIKDLLKEPGQYEQYEKYQDSTPERMQLAGVKGKLAGEGQPLQEAQEQRLMNMLYTERKAMKWDRDYTKQHEITAEYFSPDALARQFAQVQDFDNKIDQQLPTILTPEQTKVFQAQRDQQHAAEKMGVEFMKALFGEDSK